MTKIRSVDFIVTAKHYAAQEGAGSVKERILKLRAKMKRERNIIIQIDNLDKPMGAAVKARIWQGAWIADCECNGAEFVDPDEPLFFCFSCANRANGHRPRPVEFPKERETIEQLILERPVNDMAGLNDLERAGQAKPLLYVELEEETLQPVDMQALLKAAKSGKPPKPRKQTRLVGLTRTWNPGETVADLRAQQEAPIRKWQESLKAGKAHGV